MKPPECNQNVAWKPNKSTNKDGNVSHGHIFRMKKKKKKPYTNIDKNEKMKTNNFYLILLKITSSRTRLIHL